MVRLILLMYTFVDLSSCLIFELMLLILDKRKRDAKNYLLQSLTVYMLPLFIASEVITFIMSFRLNIDDMLKVSLIASPFILRYGETKEQQQFFIICKREIVLEISIFIQAVCELLAVHHVFYLKYCRNTLLFVEKFLLKILNGQELPKTLIGTLIVTFKSHNKVL